MKQHEQVIEVLKQNDGFGTLGYLYQNVETNSWKTKTPFASIRRIVQNEKYFFKIKPGLWGLNDYRDKILRQLGLEKFSIKEEEIFNHSYYQGLLVEIGNFRGYETFIPHQDKNKKYLNRSLSSVCTLTNIYEFTYKEVLQKAKTVDVVWFNQRKFPSHFFEVEYSTNIYNSLIKFVELQDFYSKYFIVSSMKRLREFKSKISSDIFSDIKERVQFIDYEYIFHLYTKTSELNSMPKL